MGLMERPRSSVTSLSVGSLGAAHCPQTLERLSELPNDRLAPQPRTAITSVRITMMRPTLKAAGGLMSPIIFSLQKAQHFVRRSRHACRQRTHICALLSIISCPAGRLNKASHGPLERLGDAKVPLEMPLNTSEDSWADEG